MTKIEAIKKTIYVLENNLVQYNWIDVGSCNCGILTQCALGIDGNTVTSNLTDLGMKMWSKSIQLSEFMKAKHKGKNVSAWGCYTLGNAKCVQSGLPVDDIFKSLFDLGFTEDEIIFLKNLSDDKVLSKLGKDLQNSKNGLILYLKAWVEILEEEQVVQEPKVEYRTVIVEVDQKVKDLTEELQLN